MHVRISTRDQQQPGTSFTIDFLKPMQLIRPFCAAVACYTVSTTVIKRCIHEMNEYV